MITSGELIERLHTLHPQLIDLSLGRIERLLARMGSPHTRLPPVIHVAGTNGKGSTVAFLKAMLEAAGRRVHVYTSPHLVRFHERIALAGADGYSRPIAEDYLVDVLSRAEAINGGEPITFFEISTAAAFLAFAETPADALILEVGLGGRLDATNVIERPALTVITPVSIDHADKLGDTLAKIAFEKAGILKRGVMGVIALQEEDGRRTIEAEARARGAPLFLWGEHFEAFEQRGRLVYQSESQLMDLPLPALKGRHQIINAGTAIAAAQHLKSLGLTDKAIEQGLLTATWPARMQRLVGGPLPAQLGDDGSELWLDGGHNPAGGAALAQSLADLEERAPKPLYLVCGMMGHKDAEGFLHPFAGLARRIVTVPMPKAHQETQAADTLAAIARGLGIASEAAASVPAALDRIRTLAEGPVRVMICGSLYLAGHVLALQEGALSGSGS